MYNARVMNFSHFSHEVTDWLYFYNNSKNQFQIFFQNL